MDVSEQDRFINLIRFDLKKQTTELSTHCWYIDFPSYILPTKFLKYCDFHNGYKTMKYVLDSTIDIFPNKKIPLLEFVPCNLQ